MKCVAVVGAGTMGAGIAQLAAGHGCTVHLIDVSGEVVRRAVDGIRERLDRSVEKGTAKPGDRDAILARITPHEGIAELSDVGLAIEAVVENLAIKREVFRSLEVATPASAVLATNTSSLSITQIAESVRDPSRVVGMHFFNPAPAMPLVEVVAGTSTAEASVDFAIETATGWGKTTVRAKDTPGFIVNRVARGYYLEALRLVEEGIAGVDEIDAILRNHGKFRMGPFELMDLVGLDVNLAVSTSVWEGLGRPVRLAPHEIQRTLVARGHLGRKTGRGFYLHEGSPLPAWMVDRKSFELPPLLADAAIVFTTRAGIVDAGSTERYVLCRILGAIFNEAALLFSGGGALGTDIDTAMVKGMNYPKGPLAWSDDVGHRTVRGLLRALNHVTDGDRYTPAPLFAGAL